MLDNIIHWNKQHKDLLSISENAGCYYCCQIFPANTVKEWCKSAYKKGEKALAHSDCAICPNCGIDSVLPDAKVNLSTDLLERLHIYAFTYD